MDLGGSRKYEGKLSNKQIQQLKEDIKQGTEYYELQNKYNISASFISSINHGIYYHDENTDYPLFQYYKKDSDYDELIELLTESYLSLADIARQLNIGYSTVKKINSGRLRKGLYPTYPIRKKSKADYVKEELLQNNLSMIEISQKYNCSIETVRRINKGETYKDNNIKYPLRNL